VVVPDIGDFKDVAVIELLVKPGDTVRVDQGLLSVESDKASDGDPLQRTPAWCKASSRSSWATRSTSATRC
jgi:hypothetical protein